MILHPDRYTTSGVQRIKAGVVVHTNEGPDGSGPSLDGYVIRPGDRPLGDGRMYGSGYHARASKPGEWVVYADDFCGPYAAPPLNKTWWHIVIPGYARQTRAEWLDEASRGFVASVASFIVWAWEHDGRTWPLSFVDAAPLASGAKGYTSHDCVSRAFKKSDHWDPGPEFPWDVLAADIASLRRPLAPIITPTPEVPDVIAPTVAAVKPRLWRHPAWANVFLIGAGPALNVTWAVYESYLADGCPEIVEAHDQMLRACLHQSGLTIDDLVPQP